MKAKCSICGKWVTLVHPTKRSPLGRLHRHQNRMRMCFGSPIPGSEKPYASKAVRSETPTEESEYDSDSG